MNRKFSFRIISLILLLALLGTGASAATLPSLLKYAKNQGFTVKVKKSTITKQTLDYAEFSEKKDTLTWTDGKKKSYVISATPTSEKARLLDLYVYLLSKPHAPGGTAMNETYEGLEVVYTEDESVYTKRAAKVEDHLGQQLVQ